MGLGHALKSAKDFAVTLRGTRSTPSPSPVQPCHPPCGECLGVSGNPVEFLIFEEEAIEALKSDFDAGMKRFTCTPGIKRVLKSGCFRFSISGDQPLCA